MNAEPTIVDLVGAWFAAATRGEPSLVERHISPGPGSRLIGSAPEEWLQGGPQITEFLRGEVTGAGGDVTFTPSDTEAFSHGDVGWAATRLTISLPDGKRITPRWSAVFVREEGVWRFVQTHASIAVPNEDVGWTYE